MMFSGRLDGGWNWGGGRRKYSVGGLFFEVLSYGEGGEESGGDGEEFYFDGVVEIEWWYIYSCVMVVKFKIWL